MNDSPLRYPGGKAKLVPLLDKIIDINFTEKPIFCEPFCGGAGAGLSLLINNKINHLIINDIDMAVYSFWYILLYKTEKLISKINKTPVSIDEWKKEKEIYKNSNDIFDLGFAFFFLNRTNFSGIIEANPIGGIHQSGKYKLNCRFNKKTLCDKIRKIASYRNRIKLYNLDVCTFLDSSVFNHKDNNVLIFLDPPYYQQGKNLYKEFFTHELHKNLAAKLEKNDFFKYIMTYDNNQHIKQIYDSCNNNVKEIQLDYSCNSKRKETELFYYNNIVFPSDSKF